MAVSVAISSATNGSPRKVSTGDKECMDGTTPASDFRIISTSGIAIMSTIVLNFGSFDSSMSSCFATCSGTGTIYFFPQYAPHTGPAIINATVPHARPIKITQPRSTFSIVATSTGPGVGGINACPTASPASSGIA